MPYVHPVLTHPLCHHHQRESCVWPIGSRSNRKAQPQKLSSVFCQGSGCSVAGSERSRRGRHPAAEVTIQWRRIYTVRMLCWSKLHTREEAQNTDSCKNNSNRTQQQDTADDDSGGLQPAPRDSCNCVRFQACFPKAQECVFIFTLPLLFSPWPHPDDATPHTHTHVCLSVSGPLIRKSCESDRLTRDGTLQPTP